MPEEPVQDTATPTISDEQAEALLAEAVNTPDPQESAAATPEASKQDGKPNPWDDPESARAEIERLRKENAKDRTTAKTKAAEEARNEFAQTIGKALGLIKDEQEPVDPAALAQQVEQSNALALQAQVENAVMRAAIANGADANALLDSVSFLEKAAALDPTDRDAFSAAVQAAVEENPRYGSQAAPQGMRPNPAQGRSASPPLTLAQQITAAQEAGDNRLAMRLKAKQAMNDNPNF